jgi:diacylglycerol kinase
MTGHSDEPEEKDKAIMMTFPSSRQSIREEFPRQAPPRRWRDRLRPACRGIKLGVRGHSRFFIHFFCTALVLAAAIVLRCDLVQWCLLLGCIGLVHITELLNNAIEALFRGLDEESTSRAAPCLDIAAGAVLMASITASLIGGLIFLSRLLEMFDPALPK